MERSLASTVKEEEGFDTSGAHGPARHTPWALILAQFGIRPGR
jgi:hypothetical protein